MSAAHDALRALDRELAAAQRKLQILNLGLMAELAAMAVRARQFQEQDVQAEERILARTRRGRRRRRDGGLPDAR